MDIEALKQLVRERIQGTRIGSDIPASEHSVRVYELLIKHEFPEEVAVAGLLHDILEDSDTTKEELKEKGVTERTIELVDLASHDKSIKGSDARLMYILGRIIMARDNDALAVKTADVLDNLRSCANMRPDRRQNMRLMKAPLIRNLAKGRVKDSLWNELNDEVREGYNAEGVTEMAEMP